VLGRIGRASWSVATGVGCVGWWKERYNNAQWEYTDQFQH
jgi:hypothetical protein